MGVVTIWVMHPQSPGDTSRGSYPRISNVVNAGKEWEWCQSSDELHRMATTVAAPYANHIRLGSGKLLANGGSSTSGNPSVGWLWI